MKREVKGSYLKSFVFGGLDGIITTFAVVAGVAGASLSYGIVLILGFANLFADGISMAVSDYLGSKAEEEYENKRGRKTRRALKNSLITFFSFLIFGFIPLFAYVFDRFIQWNNFYIAIFLTGIALILLGCIKYKITGKHWAMSAFETLIIGGLAAGIAYFVGHLISVLV